MIELNKIYQGDCLEVMKEIQDNSIDTIITDPPYGLSFMGKEWDSFGTDLKKYQEWTRRWAVEALRVAKPGATLLCFGGTRTWHRLACGLEDAGWFIKDTLMWVYGSGFPKATDISKQIDKKEGVKHPKNFPISKNIAMRGANYTRNKIPVQSEKAKFWNGWKSHGLKPAWEPIIMAMKPNEGSYAENALKWGVAGLNIDGGRIHTKPRLTGTRKNGEEIKAMPTSLKGSWTRKLQTNYDEKMKETNWGRFPANIILDEEAAKMLDEQNNNASRFFYIAKASKKERNMGLEGFDKKIDCDRNQECYSANVPFNRSANPKINNHPTVKPLKLMEYLCILTKTPTGGIVLDPFVGSGTTCIVAKKTGRNYIGIEKEEEYVKIAEARLKSIPDRLL
jgi:DNA modification methylase